MSKEKGPPNGQYDPAPILVKYYKDTAKIREAIRQPFAEKKEDVGMTEEQCDPHLDKLDAFLNLKGEGKDGFSGNVPWKKDPAMETPGITDRGLSLRALIAIREEVRARSDECKKYRESVGDEDVWRAIPGRNGGRPLIDVEGEYLKHLMVKPETRRYKKTYFEHINQVYQKAVMDAPNDEEREKAQNEYKRNVGPVNIFVSHAWKFGFIDVVNAVEGWQKEWEAREKKYDHAPFLYFFDYFAVNQHNPAADLPGLEKVILESKLMLCMMNPYNDPFTLGRSWCTLEMGVCEFSRTRLEIAFTQNEGAKFEKQFANDDYRKIRKEFAKFDTETAQAWSQDDDNMIKDRIRTELGGYLRINEMCKQAISRWYTQQAKDIGDKNVKWLKKLKAKYNELKDDEKENEDQIKTLKNDLNKCYDFLKNTATYLRQEAGEFAKAASLLVKATENVTLLQKISPNDKKVLEKLYKTQNSEANVLFEDGQFEEALPLYRKAYEGRKEVLKPDDIDRLQSELNVARCINELPLTKESIAESKRLLNANFKSREDRAKNLPAKIETMKKKIAAEKDEAAKAKLEKKLEKETKNGKKMKYKCLWPKGDLANLLSKENPNQDGIEKLFEDTIKCQAEHKNKRFLSYYKVMYASHLYRVARRSADSKTKKELYEKAEKLASEAKKAHVVNEGKNHPDTMNAEKTLIQIQYAMDPEMEQIEKDQYKRIQKGLFDREWSGERKEAEPDAKPNKNQIQVMSWNVLADKLAYGDLNKDGFGSLPHHVHWELRSHERKKLAKQRKTLAEREASGITELGDDEDDKTMPSALSSRKSILNYPLIMGGSEDDLDDEKRQQDEEVDYPGRKLRVIAEVLRYMPDVMVINELDRRTDLDLALERYGYRSVWKKKKKDFYEDGTGVYYQSRRFKMVNQLMMFIEKKDGALQDQVLVAVELGRADGNKTDDFAPFVVAGIHLKSTKAQKGEKVRLAQAQFVHKKLKEKWPKHEIILCSDLNSEAESCRAKEVNNEKKFLLDYSPETHPWLVLDEAKGGAGYQSVYPEVTGKEPYVTSWKMRKGANKDKIFKYAIDFIMTTKGIKGLSVLMPPDEDQFVDILDTLLPDSRCGSDHLPLAADLLLPAFAKDDADAGGCLPCGPK